MAKKVLIIGISLCLFISISACSKQGGSSVSQEESANVLPGISEASNSSEYLSPQPEPEVSIDVEQSPQPEPTLSLTSPENWPEHFSALVQEIAMRRDESYFLYGIIEFHLMDINLDGIPELIASFAAETAAGPFFIVMPWDFSLQEFIITTEGLDFWDALTYSGLPLRFFRNDDTGEIIYSSLVSNHFSRSIIYHYADELVPTLKPFRIVTCGGYGDHILKGGPDSEWATMEEYESEFSQRNFDAPPSCGCEIERGRNSPDPTIVNLVNSALEGFTEIPAPTLFAGWSFDWDKDLEFGFRSEHVEEVQAWIFEVAQIWDA